MNFIPYGKQTIETQDIDFVIETLKSDFLTTGPKVQEFEQSLCDFCSAKYSVVVSSGTAALHLASLVLLKEGEKVITTPNSFLATANAILYAKAKPIFVDIGVDGNIDLDLCEELLQKDPTIKAIYGVSFSGNMLNQEKLKYFKETYKVKILEDNSHSLGASFNGTQAGSCTNSDISIFSFHPVKHITTAEGGAITTNSYEIYEKILRLRNHGITKTKDMKPWEYKIEELGFNYRLSDLSCALGISQLKKVENFINRRKNIAQKYDESFQNTPIKPLYPYNNNSSYHLYVVRIDFSKIRISKEKLFYIMNEKYIGLQVHYIPINKQPYYKNLGYGKEHTPYMDKYYSECFSLPCYPTLKCEEQMYVIKSLLEVLKYA